MTVGRTRLNTIAPDLETALLAAPLERRLAGGMLAARWAVDRTGVRDPAVDATLTGTPGEELDSVVDALDREYLALEEVAEGDPTQTPASILAFSRARAVSALAFATRGEPLEAVYEAGHATDDWAGLRDLLTAL